MAISSLDHCISGSTEGSFFYKYYSGKSSLIWHDLWTATGIPSNSVLSNQTLPAGTPISYDDYLNTTEVFLESGELCYPNVSAIKLPAVPSGKSLYVKSFITCGPLFNGGGSHGGEMLYDRLWQSFHDSDTIGNTTFTVNSVQFPPRDEDGTSDGRGVHVFLVFYTRAFIGASASGATPRVEYTNSKGQTGRIGFFSGFTGANKWIAGSVSEFSIAFMVLQEGDEGVRSIQNFRWSDSAVIGMAAGTKWGLVAARIIDFPITSLTNSMVNTTYYYEGILTRPPVKIYPNSVLSILACSSQAVRTSVIGQVNFIVA